MTQRESRVHLNQLTTLRNGTQVLVLDLMDFLLKILRTISFETVQTMSCINPPKALLFDVCPVYPSLSAAVSPPKQHFRS